MAAKRCAISGCEQKRVDDTFCVAHAIATDTSEFATAKSRKAAARSSPQLSETQREVLDQTVLRHPEVWDVVDRDEWFTKLDYDYPRSSAIAVATVSCWLAASAWFLLHEHPGWFLASAIASALGHAIGWTLGVELFEKAIYARRINTEFAAAGWDVARLMAAIESADDAYANRIVQTKVSKRERKAAASAAQMEIDRERRRTERDRLFPPPPEVEDLR